MRVLVVGGESGTRESLQAARLIVETASAGEGLPRAQEDGVSLVILDDPAGLALCEAFRNHRVVAPILMLGGAGEPVQPARALDAGADDYLRRPFDERELLARVRALLRRDQVSRPPSLQVGDLELDPVAGRVRRGGKDIHLTGREYQLLEALITNEGRVLTHEAILKRVWLDEVNSLGAVKVNVGTLRRKVDGELPVKLIHTVRGVGYVLRRPD
jgi:DNA-binding response OmpR family regulator